MSKKKTKAESSKKITKRKKPEAKKIPDGMKICAACGSVQRMRRKRCNLCGEKV